MSSRKTNSEEFHVLRKLFSKLSGYSYWSAFKLEYMLHIENLLRQLKSVSFSLKPLRKISNLDVMKGVYYGYLSP